MISKKPVLIWDIDGTLLEPKPVGRQALNITFAELYDIDDAFDDLDFSGATDHALWAQVVEHAPHLQDIPAERDRFFARYVHVLGDVLARNPLNPLPSVSDLIPELSARGWPLALATGNIRAGAFVKLGAAGLAPYFPVGGFSHPHADRAALILQARQFFPGRIPVVIGDTPRDIEASRQIGAVAVGTATGRHSSAVLSSHGADLVFDVLPHASSFLEAIVEGLTRRAQEKRS